MGTSRTASADEIVERACARAQEIGLAACVAVVDAGAQLKAFRPDARARRDFRWDQDDGSAAAAPTEPGRRPLPRGSRQ